MGQDYSYSQPSSTSESVDITSLFEAEAQIYADEADSSYCNAIPVQYPRQPEADDGIPTTCYNASPQLVGTIPRKLRPCKQRWARINEQVSKFAGCYDGALREQRSGQNDDDVMQAALDIFFINNGYKFTLDHCWRELRHDQKCCTSYTAKDGGNEKRKPALEVDREEGEEGRPPGVKAAKAGCKKKKSAREEELTKLQGVLEIKEKLSKQKILDRLLAKPEPLSDMETSLKLKLMSELI